MHIVLQLHVAQCGEPTEPARHHARERVVHQNEGFEVGQRHDGVIEGTDEVVCREVDASDDTPGEIGGRAYSVETDGVKSMMA